MQQENMRLVKAVAQNTPGAEREVLQELINSNERLIAEKQKVLSPILLHVYFIASGHKKTSLRAELSCPQASKQAYLKISQNRFPQASFQSFSSVFTHTARDKFVANVLLCFPRL